MQINYNFGHRCTAVDLSSRCASFVDEGSSLADLAASSAVFIKKSPPADLLIGVVLRRHMFSSPVFLLRTTSSSCVLCRTKERRADMEQCIDSAAANCTSAHAMQYRSPFQSITG